MKVKVGLNRVLTSAKQKPRDVALVAITLAIAPTITRQESPRIAFPVVLHRLFFKKNTDVTLTDLWGAAFIPARWRCL